jgi:hypothetical protein
MAQTKHRISNTSKTDETQRGKRIAFCLAACGSWPSPRGRRALGAHIAFCEPYPRGYQQGQEATAQLPAYWQISDPRTSHPRVFSVRVSWQAQDDGRTNYVPRHDATPDLQGVTLNESVDLLLPHWGVAHGCHWAHPPCRHTTTPGQP